MSFAITLRYKSIRSFAVAFVFLNVLSINSHLDIGLVRADTVKTVTGQVLNGIDQTPVQGIKVDLFSKDRAEYLQGVTSGDDGRFVLRVNTDGSDDGCYVMTYVAPEGAVIDTTQSQYFDHAFCFAQENSVALAPVRLADVQVDAIVDLDVDSDVEFQALDMTVDLFSANDLGKRDQYLKSETIVVGEKMRLKMTQGCYVVVFIAPKRASERGATFKNGTEFDEQPFCAQAGVDTALTAELSVVAADERSERAGRSIQVAARASRGRSVGSDMSRQVINGDPMQLYTGSYALVVGLSEYTNGWDDLTQIPQELEQVRRALEIHGFEVVVKLDLPTKKDLEMAFLDFRDAYGFDPGNRLLVYFAGHGYSSDNSTVGHLVASNAPLPETIDGYPGEEFLRNSLQISQMMEWAGQMTVKHALFLFDSCFSGIIFKSRGTLARSGRKLNLKQISQPVRQFITSGSANELVPAKSVFVQMLIEALTTDIADFSRDGYLTGQELGFYLKNEVPRFSNQSPQTGTHSSWEYSRGDFVFSLNNINRVN